MAAAAEKQLASLSAELVAAQAAASDCDKHKTAAAAARKALLDAERRLSASEQVGTDDGCLLACHP